MPLRPRSLRAVTLCALSAALAGCATDGVTSPVTDSNALLNQAVAADAGAAVASQIGLHDTGETASGTAAGDVIPGDGARLSLAAAAPGTTTCQLASGGFHTCTGTTAEGLTLSSSYRFFSGATVSLSYSSATTDSVQHRFAVTGTFSAAAAGGTRTTSVHRADTATMVVVRAATASDTLKHRWSGFGVRADTSTATDATAAIQKIVIAAHDTVANLVYAMPRSAHPYPQSGSVVHDIAGVVTDRTGASANFARRALATFNGTRTATIQVGPVTCALDLVTRQTSNCQ